MSDTKRLPEFPTDWHQQAYLEGLERELVGARRRQQELRALGMREEDPALKEAVDGEETIQAELKRVGGRGQKSASKRPAEPTAERVRSTDDRKRGNVDTEDRDEAGRDHTGEKETPKQTAKK
jgi:hypothetical protein